MPELCSVSGVDVWSVLAILLAALISPAIVKVVESRLLREQRRYEFRQRFQWETLIQLQDAVSDLKIATATVYREKARIWRETGTWPPNREFVSHPGLADANHRIIKLLVRILDDELRKRVQALWKMCSDITTLDEPERVARLFVETAPVFTDVNHLIGERLRSTVP